MILNNLHQKAVAIDRAQHRATKLKLPVTDWSVASKVNSIFVASAEFGDACRDIPIVFVRVDVGGQSELMPIAVLGLRAGQNLFVEGPRWRGRYLPALLRMYPFGTVRVDAERYAVCIDMSWSGVSETEGEPLIAESGEAAPLLANVQKDLEEIDKQVEITRWACKRIDELKLLQEMRFDATLPDGRKIALDGFLTVDDAKLKALPDATLAELYRQGVLAMVHAHMISIANLRRMVDWQLGDEQRAAGAAANDQTA